MQANRKPHTPDEHEDKPLQRALLALVLDEFPAKLTRDDLWVMGVGKGESVEQAVRNLDLTGLLWCEGSFVVPTLPARHFNWLEWS